MSEMRTTEVLETSIGRGGRKFQIGAGTVTPDTGFSFIAISALDDSVITLSDVSNLSLVAGSTILGKDASVEVVSGGVVCYQGR